MDTAQMLESGTAALLFALTFLFGGRLRPFRGLIPDHRSVISFGAGMSCAYVFVHLIPELHDARRAFAESAPMPLRYEGMAIHFLALVGFLVFYGLEHLRAHLHEPTAEGQIGTEFKIHLGGFAAYAMLMAYLLVHKLEDSSAPTALYTLAVAVHFLGVDHALRKEHAAAYERVGRYLLAGMVVLGWVAALLFTLPKSLLAPLVAFVSGAIIMNSAIMELPSEKDGRFLAFMIGGILYGLILVPLG